ncbi:hypothetical protein SAMN04487830_1596 [Pseudobutyrivibrio sp. OR37]|uniref:hypothetical protein n=1 Tax=Pseudobutyrivibrio sp. OR37 TaxID=1798186 RepID=UPI0008F2CAE1|nr:hypothetical protein [Pseudobutyrivibrio sp. OR37]SFI40218.1 hypothetical protein SAMN04487830_1596 [Pseudobutyrivibrio sp. OR37]
MEFKKICKEVDLKLLELDTWGVLSSDELADKIKQKNRLLKDYENNVITLHQFELQVKELTVGLELPSKEEMLDRCSCIIQ